MRYQIDVAAQPQRAIAAVAWTTSWERFPHEWRGMLDQVHTWLRQTGRAAAAT